MAAGSIRAASVGGRGGAPRPNGPPVAGYRSLGITLVADPTDDPLMSRTLLLQGKFAHGAPRPGKRRPAPSGGPVPAPANPALHSGSPAPRPARRDLLPAPDQRPIIYLPLPLAHHGGQALGKVTGRERDNLRSQKSGGQVAPSRTGGGHPKIHMMFRSSGAFGIAWESKAEGRGTLKRPSQITLCPCFYLRLNLAVRFRHDRMLPSADPQHASGSRD
ncbi:hypothetical protein DESA109040_03670 [Deinococcus saxicola]